MNSANLNPAEDSCLFYVIIQVQQPENDDYEVCDRDDGTCKRVHLNYQHLGRCSK